MKQSQEENSKDLIEQWNKEAKDVKTPEDHEELKRIRAELEALESKRKWVPYIDSGTYSSEEGGIVSKMVHATHPSGFTLNNSLSLASDFVLIHEVSNMASAVFGGAGSTGTSFGFSHMIGAGVVHVLFQSTPTGLEIFMAGIMGTPSEIPGYQNVDGWPKYPSNGTFSDCMNRGSSSIFA